MLLSLECLSCFTLWIFTHLPMVIFVEPETRISLQDREPSDPDRVSSTQWYRSEEATPGRRSIYTTRPLTNSVWVNCFTSLWCEWTRVIHEQANDQLDFLEVLLHSWHILMDDIGLSALLYVASFILLWILSSRESRNNISPHAPGLKLEERRSCFWT